MKKLYFSTASLLLLFIFSGCKKDKTDTTDYTNSMVETSIHTDDYARFSSEMDAVAKDVNTVVEMTPGFTGKPAVVLGSICDASVVTDTSSSIRTITITYNGAPCHSNRKRFGKIILSMASNMRWKNQAAEINVRFVNYKVIRAKDNKPMTFNNSFLLTNVSGGLLSDLATLSDVTHTAWSDDLDIIFDNGKEWSWKTARKRVYRDLNGLNITTTGTHAGGNIGGIADWGNNRFGHPFTTPILLPLISREDCNYRVIEGKYEIILDGLVYATAKLGLNESGNPISCPGANNYWLELLWRDPSGARRVLRLPYE
jgi:hypothetical protein